MPYRQILVIFTCLLVAGCASLSIEQRHVAAGNIAKDAGWERMHLDGGQFVLAAFAPPGLAIQQGILTIYIEGDGLAWVDARTPSFDPTPARPLGLQLAIQDPGHQAVYLGRPCQYITGHDRRHCSNRYWTSHRFAPEIITATNLAINQLKQRYHATSLILVGYSGGGAIAALSAARRNDVIRLVTVAGNLDTQAWTHGQRLSPLTGSLNPADEWQALSAIPQWHYVGANDTVIEPDIAQSYQRRFPSGQQPALLTVPGFDHDCCWVAAWPRLIKSAR